MTDNDSLVLRVPWDITIFNSSGSTYAAVTSSNYDNGVQILDITDPSRIVAAGSILNNENITLNSPSGIETFKSGTNTYAVVAAHNDQGVQILNVTDPDNITVNDSISGGR